MTKLFISYSRQDADLTYELADRLRQHGYEVWTDITDISGGEPWGTAIERAIADCDALVVVVSSRSKDSQWVLREILLAQSQNKMIIPVRVETVLLPFPLIELQPIDYLSDRARAIARLVTTLHQVKSRVDKSPETVVPPARTDDEGTSSVPGGMSLVEFRRTLAALRLSNEEN